MGSLVDPPPNRPFTIAIIGGGIGGVALAIGLAAQHVPFHIYESSSSFGEIGAGVTFGPNVIRAIHGLSPAMLRAYNKHVTTNEPPELADAFLTYRRGYPEGDGDGGDDVVEADRYYRNWTPEKLYNLIGPVQEIDGMRFPTRCSVHRAHLLDEWVKLVPEGSASFGKALVDIEEPSSSSSDGGGGGDDDNQLLLHFADGSTATASAVVGCDGIKSVTRKYLHGPDAVATYSGFFGYRAMAPRAEYERVLGKELAETGNLYLYRNGYTIAYPVNHGAALNMFATCVQEDSTWEHKDLWKVSSTEEELRRDLGGWHPGVVDLLVRHGVGEKWAMFHCPHEEVYYRRKVCIMGDAAHATTPHLGAGAGMAIEDAFILSGLLGAIQSSKEIPKLFRVYDSVRQTRTQMIIRNSSDNVQKYIDISKAKGEELDRLRVEAHRIFGNLWEFDLDACLSEAISILKGK